MTKKRAIYNNDDDDVINEYYAAIDAGRLVRMGLRETATITLKGKYKGILSNTLIGKI